jgi:hypothetical protein
MAKVQLFERPLLGRLVRAVGAFPARLEASETAAAATASRLPLVAKADDAGWSVYGAERSQAVATGGKVSRRRPSLRLLPDAATRRG